MAVPYEDIRRKIREIYLEYEYPWVVGYSGGKDSTATLQLVWEAIAELPKKQRKNRIYVISTDTLVETPIIVNHVQQNIKLINEAAKREELPIEAHLLRPEIKDTFWVQLIGKGYPAPNNMFRWCTDRLKIKPSNRFILEKVSKHGNVILVLGSRKSESLSRAQTFNRYKVPGHKLAIHSQLRGAWVFTPIEDFSSDDVWIYLLQNKSPWGGDNRQLASLYQSAQDGECPLVVDKSTPSCGNSRFGCWTCTVVARDRSMEAIIDSGEEWLQPLLEFRDWLAETQDPELKQKQREYKGRDGSVRFGSDGRVLFRTYRLEFSREILRRLLEVQKEIWHVDKEYDLISREELFEIRRIWITERQDWQDTLPQIYREVMGYDLDWPQIDAVFPGEKEERLLEEISKSYALPLNLLQKIIDAEWQYAGMMRRKGIHKRISNIFSEEWRSLEEILEEEN